MKLVSTRTSADLKAVLKDKDALGPAAVYWVFGEVVAKEKGEWANVTVMVPGKIGQEYSKTFGHYHPDSAPDETYHLVEGEGLLQLQKKHIENGILTAEIVDEVYLIKAQPGDEVVIKKEYGHSWSNIGVAPLISYDNWRIGHTPSDYEAIEKLHGMAYYLVEENGQVKAVANPNYKNLPKPVWITAEEFNAK